MTWAVRHDKMIFISGKAIDKRGKIFAATRIAMQKKHAVALPCLRQRNSRFLDLYGSGLFKCAHVLPLKEFFSILTQIQKFLAQRVFIF
ncbi:MAG: hypothetical protein A2W80_07335 [Candidatus Riflebacteria bacterium GWC2_50_8]|nr:MAG: hypothetical protein A2W80_07335 [Candidatus Riflebacteria bacterium GWC2_50_8]